MSGEKDIEGWRNLFGEVFIAIFYLEISFQDFCSNVFVSIIKTINSVKRFFFHLHFHDIRGMWLMVN